MAMFWFLQWPQVIGMSNCSIYFVTSILNQSGFSLTHLQLTYNKVGNDPGLDFRLTKACSIHFPTPLEIFLQVHILFVSSLDPFSKFPFSQG